MSDANNTGGKPGCQGQPQAMVDQGPRYEGKKFFHPRLKPGRPPKNQPKQHWVK